jgi:hypothetical protein
MRQAEPGHWVRCIRYADITARPENAKPAIVLQPLAVRAAQRESLVSATAGGASQITANGTGA